MMLTAPMIRSTRIVESVVRGGSSAPRYFPSCDRRISSALLFYGIVIPVAYIEASRCASGQGRSKS
jgi:hypothetical protein